MWPISPEKKMNLLNETCIKQCLAKFDSKQYHCTAHGLLKLSAIASELTVTLCIWTTAMEVTPTTTDKLWRHPELSQPHRLRQPQRAVLGLVPKFSQLWIASRSCIALVPSGHVWFCDSCAGIFTSMEATVSLLISQSAR